MVSVAHILELLVPRFANVSDIPGSFPVSLDLSASMDIQLVFWESGVAKELECINVDDGCPRCKFDSFLRGLVILKRRGVLHLNGAYVVEPTRRNFARLRLHIESINEMAAASKLEEFDFVLCHLQSSNGEEEEMEEQKIAAAKRSKCHNASLEAVKATGNSREDNVDTCTNYDFKFYTGYTFAWTTVGCWDIVSDVE
ncbi:Hypothetical protein PHPALM_37134 [Phytophthora palmivora]|uniref:Uncharacterized protein n=1 Tax=Phytophthora palmivora TaxID=4796 RepID=A0A2P4WY84_9STRA|nr:Hypothetical protein PHPALM_37134 [Phytophthora palmivora]